MVFDANLACATGAMPGQRRQSWRHAALGRVGHPLVNPMVCDGAVMPCNWAIGGRSTTGGGFGQHIVWQQAHACGSAVCRRMLPKNLRVLYRVFEEDYFWHACFFNSVRIFFQRKSAS